MGGSANKETELACQGLIFYIYWSILNANMFFFSFVSCPDPHPRGIICLALRRSAIDTS